MIYGYALPLFAGLVLATPLTRRQCGQQILIGGVLIWLAQTFGVIAECLKSVGLDSGPAGLEAIQRVGLHPEVIALSYQFGYLILPALVPAGLWIACNRPFIESLVRPEQREPNGIAAVEQPSIQG
jgi:hypothetical protein